MRKLRWQRAGSGKNAQTDMATRKTEVLLTENFERNLDEVEGHLAATDDLEAFDGLLDRLVEEVIPNLARFPLMGRPISAQSSISAKVNTAAEGVKRQVARMFGQAEIREYILPSFVVLYVFAADKVFLLAIRHHRQLSYDLQSAWIRS